MSQNSGERANAVWRAFKLQTRIKKAFIALDNTPPTKISIRKYIRVMQIYC